MSERYVGQLKCDHALMCTFQGKPVVKCAQLLTEFPMYPASKMASMVRECHGCEHIKVSCVQCGTDITSRAEGNGKVYYCSLCRTHS